MKELKLGVIGMSDGNGHPYSWSAIFNGFNDAYMKDCPFPVIPDYLSKQSFPEDSIFEGKVSYIWTQDKEISKHVAKSSNIEHIVEHYPDMIGQVDGILLARDDYEHHLEISEPFLKAGLPIYIDKPIAINKKQANKIFSLQKYKGQIFTCSALGYAKEFQLTDKMKTEIGNLEYVEACIMKSWEKYSIHIIEPVLKIIGDQGEIKLVNKTISNNKHIITYTWDSHLVTTISTLGESPSPIKIRLFGSKGYKELVFEDTFYAFKKALQHFINIIKKEDPPINQGFVMKVVDMIERGLES
ncbi:Gfo/Idh/MocA family oxidoreductase [Cytobacillus dafuensis]|uniref:Gfo/Idh/MocA-like oxidoreductase N-terminal domain-containing protein n=1 Tax=Cytobacillus dafuensis TaxID=1742359 RepID=A0A5B8Z7Y1_CYTDA|nr:Gfo/Idh/MocA family oxidoreductase [Cytobacillus dafuensis]QED49195.1 hypothetical protein FSZ17_19115 [Cytobacillus dafuensis]